MDINQVEIAINAALKCDWKKAISANKEVLKEEPDDTEALNRLARAYFESGDLKEAKKTSLKVISIEPLNKIAEKALDKYKKGKKIDCTDTDHNVDVSDFIEEVGTTKQTNLLYLCTADVISTLDSGDEVLLSTHSHKVSVSTNTNKYLGKLPDDLSSKIRRLTKNGYKYKALIKSTDNGCIKIIIKEIKRGKGFEHTQSFPRESSESI